MFINAVLTYSLVCAVVGSPSFLPSFLQTMLSKWLLDSMSIPVPFESCFRRLPRCGSRSGSSSYSGTRCVLLFSCVCSLHLSKICSTSSMVGRDDAISAVQSTPNLKTTSISSEYPAYLMLMSVASVMLPRDR